MHQKLGPKVSPSQGALSLNFERLLLVFCLLLIGGTVVRVVSAATFDPPTDNPPGGNIPITIWNRESSTVKQADASIDIDGFIFAEENLGLGSQGLDLGVGTTGQNLIYGYAPYANIHPSGDNLLLLETFSPSPDTWTPRLSVNREGDIEAPTGCFGPIFQGTTALDFNGANANGYFNANNLCAAFGTGAHVCSSAEIMNSLKCGRAGHAIKNAAFDAVDAWIQDGPPGFTAPANDCQGWTSSNSSHLGRIWRFDATTGGKGFLTTCNQSVKYTCCR